MKKIIIFPFANKQEFLGVSMVPTYVENNLEFHFWTYQFWTSMQGILLFRFDDSMLFLV